jgi:hypothetical protein
MKMKRNYLSILAIIPLLLLVGITSAANMSISNLGLTGRQDVMIYDSSGVLLGVYNTSSSYFPLPPTDFTLVIKPTAMARVFNPMTLFSDGLDFVTANAIPLFILLGCGAVLIGLARKGR